MLTTVTTNEPGLKQYASRDGGRIVTIICSGGGYRFVEETEEHEAEADYIPAHSYWVEARRSGIYDSFDAAEADAIAMTPWLKAEQTN